MNARSISIKHRRTRVKKYLFIKILPITYNREPYFKIFNKFKANFIFIAMRLGMAPRG
jgi:hypothetical protein